MDTRDTISAGTAFGPDGEHLFATSGERQKMDPAQHMGTTLGTIVRLMLDGKPAPGNLVADQSRMGERILAVTQGPDGSIWLATDGPASRLLQLTRPSPSGAAADAARQPGLVPAQ